MPVHHVNFGGPQAILDDLNRLQVPMGLRQSIFQLVQRLVALTDKRSVAEYLSHLASVVEKLED
jgi:hypothetical protein